MSDTVLQKFVADTEGMNLFQQERLTAEVVQLICKTMQSQGVTQSQLAERLGKTKGRVSQILSGDCNLTLRTVADVFTALQETLRISATDIFVEQEPMQIVSMVIQDYQVTQRQNWDRREISPETPASICGLLAG
jgi:transcriptional regulator with XRE-family HTH domain